MTRTLAVLLLLLAASAAVAEEPFQERVNAAIDEGVAWLKGRGGPSGNFGVIGGDVNYSGDTDVYRYPHGCTALALLTLLKCGVPPDDAVITRGFGHIEKLGRIPRSTYEIATLMLAIEARTNQVKRERKLETVRRLRAKPGEAVTLRVKLPRRDLAWMRDLARALLNRWNDGAWRYGLDREIAGGPHDMSNTQMAMMALYTAWRCGVKVPTRIVRQTMAWTLAQQEATGPEHARFVPRTDDREYAPPVDRARGWAYIKGARNGREARVTGTMTTGGIIVLVTGRAILAKDAPRVLRSIAGKLDRGILDGLAWLDRNWRVNGNPPGGGNYSMMYLYGLERVGDLLRVHLIGGHDWYHEGAQYLLDRQVADGRWYHTDTHPPHNLLNTCFALLFLEKASLAVVTDSD